MCAYVSDYFVIQIAFDQAYSAQAYLITALENDEDLRIEIEDTTHYSKSLNDIVLGNISCYDFPGSPVSIYGFVSNGNARAFYSETYYYRSVGNYYEYHIASFDFGDLSGPLKKFFEQFQFAVEYIDDEVTPEQIRGVQIITDRKNNYPNTYGVSNGVDIEALLFTYDWFNSQQLRNRLNIRQYGLLGSRKDVDGKPETFREKRDRQNGLRCHLVDTNYIREQSDKESI